VEKIISNTFMRIGDEVEIQIDDERRAYGNCTKLPNGTRGKIVGFREVISYKSRVNGFRKPGVYHSNGMPRVKF